jgi:glycosyltransferase A (GT-A) superfamily protein (DUF2064 family)
MQRALLLFTKVSQSGRVKTRLTGYISPADASNLYSAILNDIFDMMTHLAQSSSVRSNVCYSPASEDGRIRELLSAGRETKTSFFPQEEDQTTAQRIAAAFDIAFGDGCDIAVLVFGNQPGLDQELFLEAFQLLQTAVQSKEQRLVFGPTCDGGTYFIGLTSGLTAGFIRRLTAQAPVRCCGFLGWGRHSSFEETRSERWADLRRK